MKPILTGGLILVLAGLAFLAAGCTPGETSTPVTTTPPGPAVKLAFITQPSGAVAGSALGTQPVVKIVDDRGNIVAAKPVLVELTIEPGTVPVEARLLGGTKKISVNGIVEFESLSIDKAGSYSLIASSGALAPATSLPFSIVPGPPAKLAFAAQPSRAVAGEPFTPPPVVAVQDRFGNTVTEYQGSVTISAAVTLPSGTDQYTGETQMQTTMMPLRGTLTVPVVDSAASFTDVSAEMAIPGYRLTATSGSLESASTGFFEVSPGAPVKLEVTVQPGRATAGIPFETQPKVAVEDAYGNVVNSSRASISLSITPGSGTAGATLSGTTTLVAKDGFGGLAEFTDLSIDLAGTAYTLTATSGNLASAASQAFDVSLPENPP